MATAFQLDSVSVVRPGKRLLDDVSRSANAHPGRRCHGSSRDAPPLLHLPSHRTRPVTG